MYTTEQGESVNLANIDTMEKTEDGGLITLASGAEVMISKEDYEFIRETFCEDRHQIRAKIEAIKAAQQQQQQAGSPILVPKLVPTQGGPRR